MPPRSKVDALPQEIIEQIDAQLQANGFGGYQELSEWLDEQGFKVSKSSLHRWGQDREERFNSRMQAVKIATSQAKALVEAIGDDGAALSEALLGLVQEQTFSILIELQDFAESPEQAAKLLPKIGRMVADLARATISQKKWALEAREQALKEAASEAGAAITERGLDQETADFIRNRVLGLNS